MLADAKNARASTTSVIVNRVRFLVMKLPPLVFLPQVLAGWFCRETELLTQDIHPVSELTQTIHVPCKVLHASSAASSKLGAGMVDKASRGQTGGICWQTGTLRMPASSKSYLIEG